MKIHTFFPILVIVATLSKLFYLFFYLLLFWLNNSDIKYIIWINNQISQKQEQTPGIGIKGWAEQCTFPLMLFWTDLFFLSFLSQVNTGAALSCVSSFIDLECF